LNRLLATSIVLSCMIIGSVQAHARPHGPAIVRVHAGLLQGRNIGAGATRLRVFQGIPYAAPPVGNLRWRPPQPVAAWTGVRKTTHFGPRCMQPPIFSDMVFRSDGMSEDCLYLNVWTPAKTSGARLPVLVYFYGGGFLAGDGSENRYDGASLARKGIVTVTVNYRLNVFGFLALPALANESPQHASGNYGLLDQQAALRWVHANIARFGGDPEQVTIGGESAGSISVSAQMVAPASRGLFARAIGESGALIAPIAAVPLRQAEQEGKTFTRQVGADSLGKLRAMPARTLLAAVTAKDAPSFQPDIDGLFLTEQPLSTYQDGRQAHVPLLVGSNSQEGFYPSLLKGATPTPANYHEALRKLFGDRADRALELYPGHDEAQVKRSATALMGDMFIAHSTWRWMDLQHRTGKAPVYYYYFSKARPAMRHPPPGHTPDPGAVHSGEIEYALGNLSSNKVYAWTAHDYKVSRIMQGYFARFIKTGNPNGPGLPTWPRVHAAQGGLLRQEIGVPTRTEIDHGAARQHFLSRYYTTHPSHG
jgi:para-nitrobenzyl esterase